LVAARRGSVPNPNQPLDDDVIDPYRRTVAVYEASARQLLPAADVAVRVLGRAAHIMVDAA